MTRNELKSRVGPDGMLTLQVPVGKEDANREVVVTVQPVGEPRDATFDREEWKRFVAETAGSIQDPTFIRHEQGELEEREEWG